MKIKVFAVIDTNVIVSSIFSESSFPAQVLELVAQGNVIPLFDKRMLNEYYQVLNYPKFKDRISDRNVYDALYTVVSKGIIINDVEQAKIELKDKGDIPFFEVKESTEDFNSYLVTGNIKHFPESDTTVTPHVMIAVMKQFDKFLEHFESQQKQELDYNQSVDRLIKQHLVTGKYTLGKELAANIFNTNTKTVKKDYFERD